MCRHRGCGVASTGDVLVHPTTRFWRKKQIRREEVGVLSAVASPASTGVQLRSHHSVYYYTHDLAWNEFRVRTYPNVSMWCKPEKPRDSTHEHDSTLEFLVEALH